VGGRVESDGNEGGGRGGTQDAMDAIGEGECTPGLGLDGGRS